MSYGTGVNSNTLGLDGTIVSTTLGNNCVWNGNAIAANKVKDGSVSDTECQRSNKITTASLQSSAYSSASGVCPLDSNSIIPTQYLPGSANEILEVAIFSNLPTTGESNKICVTLDNHKAYRWSGTAYVEIPGSVVLGTSAGTAYDGASGQSNADAIATKQAQFGATATGGLSFVAVGSAGTLQIDMTKATAETSFDDAEFMLIEKTTGTLCRITKQHLQSSINTNTEYTEGAKATQS